MLLQLGERQDLAWSPTDFEPDPCEPDPCRPEIPFFYRPGELLVRDSALREVTAVLETLGVRFCRPGRGQGERIVRLLVASREPVPELLRRLQCYGLGLDRVGPNHVHFAGYKLGGVPWFSGGADSLPAEAYQEPMQEHDRGAGAVVAVFDSGLLSGYKLLPAAATWLSKVSTDGEPEDDDNPAMMDIYDNHGLFVSGIIGYTAPQADVRVRNILSELGEVDDAALAKTIDSYLATHHVVRLVNLSLGGATMYNKPPLALQDLVDHHENVVFVASAGNAGSATQPFYPAALPKVVGVGALDHTGQPAPFSNSSPESAKVWALGVDVVSAFRGGSLLPPPPLTEPVDYDSGLATWSGTSFAAPRVTATLCDYLATGNNPTGYGALAWLAQTCTPQSGGLIIIS